MRLNVEVSASGGQWNDDKLRRVLKLAISDAVNDTIRDFQYGELHSLKLVKPAPRKAKS